MKNIRAHLSSSSSLEVSPSKKFFFTTAADCHDEKQKSCSCLKNGKKKPTCVWCQFKNTFKPQIKNQLGRLSKKYKIWGLFFVTDPVVLVNQIKAHGLSCRISLSWQAKNHSSTLFYGRELLTDCGDQRACWREFGIWEDKKKKAKCRECIFFFVFFFFLCVFL